MRKAIKKLLKEADECVTDSIRQVADVRKFVGEYGDAYDAFAEHSVIEKEAIENREV